jgi:PBP1b-binding outer membrane lipoprotein LpoB
MAGEKSMRTIAIFIIATLFLAGCSTTPRVLEVSAVPIDKPQLILPDVDKLELKEIEWIVINEANVQEVWKRISDDKKDVVLFGLTDDGYEQLSINLSDIMTLIQQQKAIIVAYRNYYEEANEALDNANSQNKKVNKQVEDANTKEANKKWWQIK